MSRTSSSRPRANLLGVGVDAVNMTTAIARLLSALERRERGYVCVTGVHGIMEAQRDPALRRIHNSSLMTTPDGMPTVWIGRAQGHRAMGRVYGPQLMLEFCKASQHQPITHYLYGGVEGVAERLRLELENRFPGLRVVGTFTPPFRPLNEDEERRLINDLKTLRPDVLWVGLSTPKQERFMAANIDRLPVKLMIGVGAAFDMHTGRTRQAPGWMQGLGLEWLFRLMTEPRRLWRRYLSNNPRFILAIALQGLRIRDYALEA
jgi:N-acetylglucosaminyldiphosphoundecaprenol N-acetyl-beta-D-mannosaminyltransferase